MGFLRDQSTRLLREDGWTAPDLASELYAIFNAEVPFTVDGPVQITNTDNAPGMTIYQAGPLDTAFQIVRPGLPAINFQDPAIPPIDVGGPGDGGTTDTRVGSGGGITSGTGDGDQVPVSTGGGGLAGTVVSGSGSSYMVQLQDGRTVAVTQLQIDPAATIPAGTAAIVVFYMGGYVMQVPVWLGG